MIKFDELIYRAIPNAEHRYPTCGDYWQDEFGIHHIRVSQLSDWRYQVLILIHELCEYALCLQRGISEEEITAFDKIFEHERSKGKWSDEEPGDDKRAPYHLEHQTATQIERIMAHHLRVNWKDYEEEVADL